MPKSKTTKSKKKQTLYALYFSRKRSTEASPKVSKLGVYSKAIATADAVENRKMVKETIANLKRYDARLKQEQKATKQAIAKNKSEIAYQKTWKFKVVKAKASDRMGYSYGK